MKYPLYFSPILLMLPLSMPAYALEDEDLFLFDDDIPIVLTSSRLKQPITEAPTAMTIIDRKRIKQSGAREIAELFQLVPGMIVGFEYGDWPVVTYHGMSDQFSRRMQILIDGRAVYLPDVGGPDWSSLPLIMDDIERIEITRGSNAATYGSNSFMGVINIITQHSSEAIGKYLSYSSGDNEVNQLIARYSQTFGDFDYRVTVKEEENNYYNKPNHYQSSTIVTLRTDYQINSQDHLVYQAGYTDKMALDRKNGIIFPHTIKRYFHQFEWTQTLSQDHELKLQLYYSNHKHLNSFKNTQLGHLVERDDNVNNKRYDFEVQYTFSALGKLRGVIGASSRKDKLSAPLAFATNDTFEIDTQRIFGTLEYRLIPKWLFHFGSVIEAHSSMDKKVSPRVSANYKVTRSSTVRMGVSKAYRAPLAFERYANLKIVEDGKTYYFYTMDPDVNVKAEEVTSIDLGYIIKERNSPYTLDLRLFREEITQIISPYEWKPEDYLYGTVKGFDNNANATLQGFESSFEYKTQNFNALLNYSYTDIKQQYTSSVSDLYPYADSAPKHQASLLLAKNFRSGIEMSAIYYLIDDYSWLGAGDKIDAYRRLDLKIQANININKSRSSVSVVLQNALSDDHHNFDDGNNFTRRIYATFTMELY